MSLIPNPAKAPRPVAGFADVGVSVEQFVVVCPIVPLSSRLVLASEAASKSLGN